MRISVRVTTQARENAVIPQEDGTYRVLVTKPAVDDKANHAVIKALAHFFDLAPSLVRIVRGQTKKTKLVEIERR
ncbi:MAG: DUF167 domain-containing protein [Patescibacteria group bacterium]